ncbi:MAG: hypothetical protein JWM43_2286 [Acidobacteriaceae bacterium]|nr:hypothetical protein [Acidobacteriaceae bacterium]
MPKILLIGSDFRLLANRAAILSSTGASIVCCNPMEMMRDLKRERFDLVVLCHSLPTGDGEAVFNWTQIHWPGAKVLQVRMDAAEKKPGAGRLQAALAAAPSSITLAAMALLETLPKHRVEEIRHPVAQLKRA